jgi:hypothetical protein
MDTGKEGLFGGLPEVLFGLMIAKLLGSLGAGGAEAAAAGQVLVSLAKAEHAAAVSTKARLIDVIVKTVEINAGFEIVKNAGSAGLPAAYAALKVKLDELAALYA